MLLDGFGSGIGLVYIIGSSLLVNSFVLCGATNLVHYGATTLVLFGATNLVLCGATTLVLYGATTLVLCGTTTHVLCGTTIIVLCGTHHPLLLHFLLIGWFSLCLGFGLSFDDILGQSCEETILFVLFAWQIPRSHPL
jgi:hypothetical protein